MSKQSDIKNAAAVLGRKGGAVSSEKKRKSSARNWKKALAALKAKRNENNLANKPSNTNELQPVS